MRRFVAAILLLLAVMPSAANAALLIQGYSANLHDRFYSGADKAFIGAAYDWSGIGQVPAGPATDANRFVVMISPSYFLTSKHYAPNAGSSVVFYPDNTTANPQSYTVSSTWHFTTMAGFDSDLTLGKLTTPVDTALIHPYSVMPYPDSLPAWSGLIDVYGQPQRVGRNVADDIVALYDSTHNVELAAMRYRYDTGADPNSLGADEALLVAGDSGGPSFAVINGKLVLVGIHYGLMNDGITSIDSYVPYYLSDLQGQLALTGESIAVAPEPSTLMLLLGGPLLLIRRRRRAA